MEQRQNDFIEYKMKPFKIEIATKAGNSPKINVKFYTVNKQGQATIMVTKTSDSDFDDVKVFVFDVIMYLLDGLIDKELSDESLEKMKASLDFKKSVDDELSCKVCGKKFKTRTGLEIHMSKGHEGVGYGDVTSSKESSSEMKKDNKCSHLHVQKNCEVCEKKKKQGRNVGKQC